LSVNYKHVRISELKLLLVVAYARTDDGLELVGLLGQKLGVHAEVKLG
jgi:hypothetical protein